MGYNWAAEVEALEKLGHALQDTAARLMALNATMAQARNELAALELLLNESGDEEHGDA